MILSSISAYGFRNCAAQNLRFGAGLHVLFGTNAQGKTNWMEAMFCLASGRSFRNVEDTTLCAVGAPGYALSGEVLRGQETLRLRANYDREKKRRSVELNGAPLRRVLELWAEVQAVAFTPADSQLVKGAPFFRRQFLNRFLCQTPGLYRFRLLRYSQALRQRNALLKRLRRGERAEGLDLWDAVYLEFGQPLVEARQAIVERLQQQVNEVYRRLSAGPKPVQIGYKPSSPNLAEELPRMRTREIAAGLSLLGPHLDDLTVTLDGKDARLFSSEGEARTLALALRLAEYSVLQEQSGEAPLLFLDDALSELDRERQGALLRMLVSLPQAFLTSASSAEILQGEEGQRLYVRAGQIRETDGTG
ncbi:MAG: DNA replication and repair protein RecF [bacterium]